MGKIYIIGMGPGSIDCLTKGALDRIHSGVENYLRTENHPTVKYFIDNQIEYQSFDYLYEENEDFSNLYSEIADKLVDIVDTKKEINYFVPGNPMVAEKSVVELLNRNVETEIISGMSFIEPVIELLGIDIINGIKIIDAEKMNYRSLDINSDILITQVYNKRLLTEVKLHLSEVYGDEYGIFLIHSAGIPDQEEIIEISTFELDRVNYIGSLSSVFVPKIPKNCKKVFDFSDLSCIIESLRGVNGCPWDIEQTHSSIKADLIEESYEAVHAIENDDLENLCEELGDVLLQVVFHSEIARENGDFNIYNVTTKIVEKLIYRHPHVFSDLIVNNKEELMENWDNLKYGNRGIETISDKLNDIKGLPSLLTSYKIQKKMSKVGFDWTSIDGAYDKLFEEIDELKNADDFSSKEEELGDLLFSVVNIARFMDINPETALMQSVNKFKNRVQYIENELSKKGLKFEDTNISELESLWEKSKVDL